MVVEKIPLVEEEIRQIEVVVEETSTTKVSPIIEEVVPDQSTIQDFNIQSTEQETTLSPPLNSFTSAMVAWKPPSEWEGAPTSSKVDQPTILEVSGIVNWRHK